MQRISKFILKINVISNGLEKYMSFTVSNKLSFIDSFQWFISLLESLVKNSSKDDFKYLSQEFDNSSLTNDGKALYKLLNNAICRKTIENLRNRINRKLVNNKKTI